MRFHRTTTLMLVFLVASFALLAACKKTPPPAEQTPPPVVESTPAPEPTPAAVPFGVTSIDLGKAIGSDKKISEPATTFGPNDTIYAAVSTDGSAPAATLKAKWTYGDAGQLVKEEDTAIASTGPATTEFHISKPSGWPVGKYKVEIWADGTSAGTKEFEVKK
jgi:hypothetical protein